MVNDVKNLLVFSPQAQFAEWLRLSLEETGRYRVILCASPADIFDRLAQEPVDLLIADFPTGDTLLREHLEAFSHQFPHVPLLLFPPENDPYHPEASAILAWAYLSKPFYLPDLLLAVETLCRGEKILPPPPQMPQPLEALHQHLTTFLSQSDAQATWIYSAGRVLVQTGDLETSLHEYLEAWVQQREQRLLRDGEWLRYVTPLGQSKPILLYAHPLASHTLLLVFFAASTLLSRARQQGRALAESLEASPWLTSELLLAEASATSPASPPEESTGETEPPTPEAESLVWMMEADGWKTPEDEGEDESISLPDLSLLEQWLAEAPPPDPEQSVRAEMPDFQADWLPEVAFTPEVSSSEPPALEETLMAEAGPSERGEIRSEVWTFEPGEVDVQPPEEAHEGAFEPPPDFFEALAVATGGFPSEHPVDLESSSPTLSVEDTQPLTLDALNQPAAEKPLYLTYTAVLVTTLPEALQNPKVTMELTRWMPHWCQRLGWTLKRLVVTSNYLLWTIAIPSSVTPRHMVHIVRHHSAWRLFHRVPEALADLAPDSFWAPMHLAIADETPPSNAEIEALIAQNRAAS
ncbi:hypothetical protein SE15_02140 [Thermanaerothrix daxensis]|uniref:Response regulatory domain-containing protein n=1 Tax=Thermanaerothrix daxensis TaxID=869279 RepID=A0A0P6XUR5_9CHLR|nr:response regulator [Thermanaerothrix daxensis]KPL84012.1 hypothetical protein SE15_02140 [Thermanaerothrix daxensis]